MEGRHRGAATTPMAHGRFQPASILTLPPRATRRPSWRGAVLIPLSRSRREAIRTNLWAVPSGMVLLVLCLFGVTYSIDRHVAAGELPLAAWLTSGGPDVARMLLIAIATSVITVAVVVFSITMLVLQLASQQFGP